MADADGDLEEWTQTGMAMLCFAPSGESFQGRLIASGRKQYGLTGQSCGPPPVTGHYHQCCFDGDPAFFRVRVVDFAHRSEVWLDHVMKTNGDNCSLTSDRLEFRTDELIVGARAEEAVGKFFGESLRGQGCHICVGRWSMKATFPPQAPEQDSDSDF